MPIKKDGMLFEVHPTPIKGKDGKNIVYARPAEKAKLTMEGLEDYCERNYNSRYGELSRAFDFFLRAAVSPKEKEVLREAMNRGYNIILLRENGFPKLYKPSGEAFDACAKGVLLQISPWDFHYERRVITREQCLHLNAMAERIVDNG